MQIVKLFHFAASEFRSALFVYIRFYMGCKVWMGKGKWDISLLFLFCCINQWGYTLQGKNFLPVFQCRLIVGRVSSRRTLFLSPPLHKKIKNTGNQKSCLPLKMLEKDVVMRIFTWKCMDNHMTLFTMEKTYLSRIIYILVWCWTVFKTCVLRWGWGILEKKLLHGHNNW